MLLKVTVGHFVAGVGRSHLTTNAECNLMQEAQLRRFAVTDYEHPENLLRKPGP